MRHILPLKPRPEAGSGYNHYVSDAGHRMARATSLIAEPGRRRILAIDYGRKRIGLALSDELRLTAQPLATMAHTNRRHDVRRLRDICRDHGVAHIIVGHPVHMSGEAGEMAGETARFAARLKKELGVDVELVDERLTTWDAEQVIADTKPGSRRKPRMVDDVAAAVLLRDYLERGCSHVQVDKV